jgi:O-antigen/teichoic acid export membrane protein
MHDHGGAGLAFTTSSAPTPPPVVTSRREVGAYGILRNISWLAGASILVKPAWLVFMVAVCPRLLGVEGYGVLSAALALTAIATSFSDIGVSQLTVRDVAQRRRHAGRYFSNLLLYRGALLGVTLVIAVAAALALGYRDEMLVAIGMAGLYWVGHHVLMYERAFFRAAEDLRLDAISNVVEKVLVIGIGGAVLVMTRSAASTLGGMAAGMLLLAGAQAVWLSRRLAPFSRRLLSSSFIKATATRALPLGLADLLTVLYLRIDQVMIEAFLGAAAVAPYGQAYRILEALSIVPVIVAQSALFPRLSVLAHEGKHAAFRRIAGIGAAGLLAAGSVIAAGLYFVGPALLRGVTPDPEFAASGDVLRVLCWAYPLTAVKDMLFVAFVAKGKLKLPVVIYAIATVLNIALNLAVIPVHGIIGAAAVTVSCEAVVVTAYTIYVVVLLRRSRGAASPA